MNDIQLLNKDCIQGMRELASNSIDCMIADPPYNISRKTNFNTLGDRSMDFGEWDKDFELYSFIQELPRVLKENSNVVIFNSWENLGSLAVSMRENNITVKRCLVLSKTNPAPFNRDRLFVNDVEFALWGVYNSKNKPTKWTFDRQEKYEKCVINTTVQSRKYHPTMKDINVIEKLLMILSNKGDTILDPFSGSGTTAIACINNNRNFIGFELDKDYYDISLDRVEKETGVRLWNYWGGRMKLKVKFDFIHNIEKTREKQLRKYKENPEAFVEEFTNGFKQALKEELNHEDYCWIENLDVKVVKKWKLKI